MSKPTSQASQTLQPTLSGSSPLSKKRTSNTGPESPPGHIKTKLDMARELVDEIVGGMPYQNFFQEFMTPAHGRLTAITSAVKSFPQTYFNAIPFTKVEADMYEKLIELIKAKALLPNFEAVVTANNPDKNSLDGRKWKPDISVYEKGTFLSKAGEPVTENIMQFDKVELPHEIKPDGVPKPFSDPPPKSTSPKRQHVFQTDGSDATVIRGQLISVMTEMCARQHRLHAFMVYLNATEVRFLRADRSGLVVSESVDYRKNSQILAEFYLRFNKLSRQERGWDPTVEVAPDNSQTTKAKEKLKPFCVRPELSTKERHLHIITIPGVNGAHDRKVYTYHSLSDPESLTGRATRGYPAYDSDNDKIYFLKDMWRNKGLEGEYNILEYLNDKGVPHIPTVLAGGDVPGTGQTTRTQEFVNESWVLGKVGSEDYEGLDCRVHHRLLENFIPHRIWDCINAKDMITVVYHAFLAHKAAYAVGYLHRDISDRNVMMKKNGDGTFSGILSDWDLAVRVKDENGEFIERNRRQRYRTGTWYFISARLLHDPYALHTLQDDLESFLHLVLYFSLSRFEVNQAESKVDIEELFARSAYYPNLGTYKGGTTKMSMIVLGVYVRGRTFQDNGALVSWISATRKVFLKYYGEFTEPYDQVSRRSENFDTEVVSKAFKDALSSDSWSSIACLGHPSNENSPSHHMDGEGSASKTKGKSRADRPNEDVFAGPGTSRPDVAPASGSGGLRRSDRNKGKPPRT